MIFLFSDYFKINLLKKFQDYRQSVKQFESRSGLTCDVVDMR